MKHKHTDSKWLDSVEPTWETVLLLGMSVKVILEKMYNFVLEKVNAQGI